MIDRNMIILGLTNPANCALGTGHVLGISKDKVILDGLFGLEVQLGMGNRDVTIEREHGKKNPLSLMLKFNRHNVFLGFKLRW